MDVAGDELARGAAETVSHGDDEAFLHRHYISEVRMVLQGVHDRQFGGAGIAEQMRDALVLQQCKECGTAGDFVLHVSSSQQVRWPAGWRRMIKLEERAQWREVMAALRGRG